MTESPTKRLGQRILDDVLDVLRAASPTPLHLRNRLSKALLARLVVDIIGSTLMYLAQQDATTASGAIERPLCFSQTR